MGTRFAVTELFFWTEAGGEAGIGHLSRCTALAQAARDIGISSHFLLSESAVNAAEAFADWAFSHTIFKCNDDVDRVQQLVASFSRRVLIADGYHLCPKTLAKLQPAFDLVVVMDDGERRLIKHADIVVNPATKRYDDDYLMIKPDVVLCTGESYRLLRQCFHNYSAIPFSARDGIVINFGGSDPLGLTIPVLNAISKADASISLHVITGPAYPWLGEMRTTISALPSRIRHSHCCANMALAWGHAKLAVSAAGMSQFELGVCETPAILVQVADNQEDACRAAAMQKWCKVVMPPFSVDDIADSAVSLYHDKQALMAMQRDATGRYDGFGAKRAIEVILRGLSDKNSD